MGSNSGNFVISFRSLNDRFLMLLTSVDISYKYVYFDVNLKDASKGYKNFFYILTAGLLEKTISKKYLLGESLQIFVFVVVFHVTKKQLINYIFLPLYAFVHIAPLSAIYLYGVTLRLASCIKDASLLFVIKIKKE